jgi:lysophospholipase L1-like esterase
MRVVGVGDSLSVGINNRRATLLASAPPKVQYESLAKGGAYIRNFILPQDNPEIVHVLGGTNDALSGRTSTQMLSDMFEIVNRIQDKSFGKTYVIVLKTPLMAPIVNTMAKAIDATNANMNLAEYNSGLYQLSSANNVTVIDAGISPSDLGPDGIHLTNDGYDRLARAIGQQVTLATNKWGYWTNPSRVISAIGVRNLILFDLAFYAVLFYGSARGRTGPKADRK